MRGWLCASLALGCAAAIAAACGGGGDSGGGATTDAGSDAPAPPPPPAPNPPPGPAPRTAGTCGDAVFAERWGGTDDDGAEIPGENVAALATDTRGHVFATGWVRGDVDFDGGALDAGGHNDSFFLLDLDATRATAWTRVYGDPSQGLFVAAFAHGYALASHPSGGVVAAGAFAGTIRMGGAPLASHTGSDAGDLFDGAPYPPCALPSDCYPDAFVARFDANGNHVFSTSFGGPDGDAATAVAVAPSGETFVVGEFQDAVDFGGTTLTSAGKVDDFVLRLDESGAVQSAWRLGGADAETARAIVVTPDGDVVVGGSFSGSMTIGATTLTSSGKLDGFLARFSSSGQLRWAHALGASTSATVHAIATDAAGALYVSGSFAGTMNLAGAETSLGRSDAFVAKLDGTGTAAWARAFGGDDDDRAAAVGVAPSGAVYVAGTTQSISAIDYGGGKIGGGLYPGPFVVELDGSGAHTCSRAYEGHAGTPNDAGIASAGASADALVVLGAKSFAIGGGFAGSLDVGRGPLVARGGSDLYVAELQP